MGIETLFEGQELSPEFKEKVQTIFEASVAEKAQELKEAHQIEIANMQERFDEELKETSQKYEAATEAYIEEEVLPMVDKYIEEEVVPTVDAFLNRVVAEWVEENRIAIEGGIKTELAESFITSLKTLFEEHYVEVPESKVDVVEEMKGQLEEMKARLDSALNESIEKDRLLDAAARKEILAEATANMTETEKEKLQSLVETVATESLETYKRKVGILAESVSVKEEEAAKPTFDVISESVEVTTEDVVEEEVRETDPIMARYLSALDKFSKTK